GARNVLVSMAGLGAVLVTEDGTVLTHEGIDGKVKNSVGAGDSMVAGFIAGYKVSGDFKEALKMGMAAGSATAFEEDLATGEQIKSLFHKL
ncbi:MAG: 1-phosphofructokinase, partial [Niameybacter sp.]|nr:1-phosphofructokinase [Niameybacter sp.]